MSYLLETTNAYGRRNAWRKGLVWLLACFLLPLTSLHPHKLFQTKAVLRAHTVYQKEASASILRSLSEAEDRRARRQAEVDKIEIPEDQVEILDLVGKGGFANVHVANYRSMEENVAVKVCHNVIPRLDAVPRLFK